MGLTYLATFLPLIYGINMDMVEPQTQAFRRPGDDPSSPKVAADGFSYGVGAVLTQKRYDGNPVTYISRSLIFTDN